MEFKDLEIFQLVTKKGTITEAAKEGLPLRGIARRLGRNVSTIFGERKRGSVQQIDTNYKPYTKYFPDVGAQIYEENRKNREARSTVMKAWEFTRFAEEKSSKRNGPQMRWLAMQKAQKSPRNEHRKTS